MRTVLLLVALLTAPPAWATTLTFTPGEDTLDWTWATYQTPTIQEDLWRRNYFNTVAFPSAGYAMYNAYGVNNILLDGPAGTVEGFWVAPWMANDTWYDPYSAHFMSMQGWTGNGWTSLVEVPLTPGFQYVTTGWTDPVSMLWLRTNTQEKQWFVLDDITMTVTPESRAQFLENRRLAEIASKLPEPATWLYCLIGLAIVGWCHIKRRVLR